MTATMHRTLSGGLVIEDGESGATVDNAGNLFTWGSRGKAMIGALKGAATTHVAGSESWDVRVLNSEDGEDEDNKPPAGTIWLSDTGLGERARRLLQEDGLIPDSGRQKPPNAAADETRRLMYGDKPSSEQSADAADAQRRITPSKGGDSQETQDARERIGGGAGPTGAVASELKRLQSLTPTPERRQAIAKLQSAQGDPRLKELADATSTKMPEEQKPTKNGPGRRMPLPGLPAGTEAPGSREEVEEWSKSGDPRKVAIAARIVEAMRAAAAITAPPSLRRRER
jgi:hypothetical protein